MMHACLCTHTARCVTVPLYKRCIHADSSAVLVGDNACFFNTAVQVLRATPGLVDGLKLDPELCAEAAQENPQRLAAAFLKLANEVCWGWATSHGLLVGSTFGFGVAANTVDLRKSPFHTLECPSHCMLAGTAGFSASCSLISVFYTSLHTRGTGMPSVFLAGFIVWHTWSLPVLTPWWKLAPSFLSCL